MMIEINNKSALRDSYTPGYGSGCGCGSRRYYTKDEVDALLAGIIDPDEVEQIINNLFEEYIEEGDLEQLIIDAIAGMYTNEEIDDMLAELEARIKTWVESKGYLTDIDLTINGTTLHNGDSIDIEGGGGSDEYVKKSVIPEVITREFLAVSPDNKITVRIKNTDTGAETDYERYIKRINGIPLITQVKQDDIELPSFAYVDSQCVKKSVLSEAVIREFLAVSPDNKITVWIKNSDTGEITDYERYIKRINGIPLITPTKENDLEFPTYSYIDNIILDLNEVIASLSNRIDDLQEQIDEITGATPTPPAPDTGGTLVITAKYNVDSTSTPIRILNHTGGIQNIILENGTTISPTTAYTFDSTGIRTLKMTLKKNYLQPRMFRGCTSVVEIVIPEGIKANTVEVGTILEGHSFAAGCSNLTGCSIPSTMKNVNVAFFSGCTSLNTIKVYATSAPSIPTSISQQNPFNGVSNSGTLYYPSGSNYSTWLNALPSGWTGSPTL